VEAKEKWKAINEFPTYEVSTRGRVRSTDRTLQHRNGAMRRVAGAILKPYSGGNGYLVVMFPGHKNRRVHRLVAETFLANPDPLPQVNHIDGDKCNNCAGNLEWCTAAANVRHAFRNGLAHAPALVPVVAINPGDGSVITFESLKSTRAAGFDPSAVSMCLHGRRPYHRGYVWRNRT